MCDDVKPSSKTGDGFSNIEDLAGEVPTYNSDAVKSILAALELFTIMMVAHAVGGYLIGPPLADIFYMVPSSTMAMISSSTFSSSSTIFYAFLRYKYFPHYYVNKTALAYIVIGCLFTLGVVLSSLFYSGSFIPFVSDIWSYDTKYFLFTIALLMIVGPITEEIVFRGYIFELLKRKTSPVLALAIVSLLFYLMHGFDFDIPSLFIFVYSVVFTFVYIKGGLLASTVSHISANCFLFFISSYW